MKIRIKSVVKRVFGFAHRLPGRDAARLEGLEQAWRLHLPAFLNAASTVGAFGYQLARLRRETEIELRSLRQELAQLRGIQEVACDPPGQAAIDGGVAPRGDSGGRTLAIGVAERRNAAQRSPLRINLNCKPDRLDGFVNVSWRETPGADVVADPGDLPFEPSSVSEFVSSHALDYFRHEECRDRLLPSWRSLIAPGGRIRLIGCDAEAIVTDIAAGRFAFDEFRKALSNSQHGDGACLQTLFTPDRLADLLRSAGFVSVEFAARGRRSGGLLEFEIHAMRSSS